jgi:predicted phage terminase large subunit-like protein
MAAFDAMAGVELPGDWLHYYSIGDPEPGDIRLPLTEGKFTGRKIMAVDPAISLADTADHFAMAIIGLTEDDTQAFLLDTYLGRVDFPDQIDLIKEWWLKYRPEYIGIESNAYQRVLADQAARMEGMPPVVATFTKAKKHERILGMAPLFKIGKIRIHSAQRDFIEQWVSYDSTKKNPEDDLLDAVESALAAAGVLLPSATPIEQKQSMTLEEEAAAADRASGQSEVHLRRRPGRPGMRRWQHGCTSSAHRRACHSRGSQVAGHGHRRQERQHRREPLLDADARSSSAPSGCTPRRFSSSRGVLRIVQL